MFQIKYKMTMRKIKTKSLTKKTHTHKYSNRRKSYRIYFHLIFFSFLFVHFFLSVSKEERNANTTKIILYPSSRHTNFMGNQKTKQKFNVV